MIYAIRAVGTNFFKLGFTRSWRPEQRLADLQIGCPHELKVLAFGPGEIEDEAKYHWRLEQVGAHVRGEWFELCEMAHQIIWEINRAQEQAQATVNAARNEGPTASARLARVIEFARKEAA